MRTQQASFTESGLTATVQYNNTVSIATKSKTPRKLKYLDVTVGLYFTYDGKAYVCKDSGDCTFVSITNTAVGQSEISVATGGTSAKVNSGGSITLTNKSAFPEDVVIQENNISITCNTWQLIGKCFPWIFDPWNATALSFLTQISVAYGE